MAPSPELLGRLDPSASTYLQALGERVVIFDGAMGTNLQLLGLGPDDFGGPDLEGCNEWLVETRPDLVAQVHRSFYEVGCDVVETDTFGSTSVVLAEYGLADRARELTRRAAELACAVRDEFSTPERPRWVAGSMGPGTKFPTLGHISYAEFRDAYEEQALGLLEGGVDLLLIETQFDMLSIKAAVNGARRAMVALDRYVPLQTQVTIELTGRMLPGTEIGAALTVLDAMQVDVVGLNCATGPVEMSEALRHLSGASRVPIACVPNAGLPSVVDGLMHYDLTPEDLAGHLHRFVTEFGVSAIGGCCGTTPEHLAAVVERCAGATPAARTPLHEPAAASIYTSVPFKQDASFLVVGERTNANGSRAFREAMLDADWDTCVAMARDQVKEGSHLIDVCVDYTGADGVSDMTDVASRLCTQSSVPLMVDSTEGPVVRAALSWIGGRPILNSVNLEEGDEPGTRLDTFLRLAREFGAAVVCTCIDEEGQARTAEWKLRAARNIRDIAVERYGLAPEDLLFDPLALPLSTGMEESRRDGIETLEGIRAIKAELPGVSTILGLSNVSFGLNPAARQVLNSVYLHECVEAGLDAAIVHASKILPLSRIDDRVKEVCLDLVYDRRTDGYDPLQELLGLFEGVKVDAGAADEHLDWPVDRRLSQRIIDGNRNGLEGDLTEALESGTEALAIVNDILLEGMKVVGERFASGEMQLPFVLQSAETMKTAVAFLEPHMEKSDQGGKGTVVLATVKGDVHDIGKNLVDIILTNNGYEVVNLGIKIGINEMVSAVEEHKADAIGMSGLLVKSTLIIRENLVELNDRVAVEHPGPPRRGGPHPHLRRAGPARGVRRAALLRARRLRGSAHHGPPGRAQAQGRGRPHLRARDLREERPPAQQAGRPGHQPGGGPARPRRRGRRQPALHPALRRGPGGRRDPDRRDRRVHQPDRAVPQPVGLPARGRRERRRVQGPGEGDAARAAGQGQGGRPPGAVRRLRPLRRQRRGQRPRHLEGRDAVVGVDALHLPPPAQGALALHRGLLPPDGLGRRGLRQLHAVHHRRPGVGGDGPPVRREPLPGVPLPARPQRRDGRGHGRVLAPPDPRGARVRRRGRPDPHRAVQASSTGAGATRGATRPAPTSPTTPRSWSCWAGTASA